VGLRCRKVVSQYEQHQTRLSRHDLEDSESSCPPRLGKTHPHGYGVSGKQGMLTATIILALLLSRAK
jgi:hypothetical protein